MPSATTTAAIQSYVNGVNAAQTGAGNYLELLGYLLLLVFATYLYAVARAICSERLHWLNVLVVTAATTYVAVSALAIAAQQVLVESNNAGRLCLEVERGKAEDKYAELGETAVGGPEEEVHRG